MLPTNFGSGAYFGKFTAYFATGPVVPVESDMQRAETYMARRSVRRVVLGIFAVLSVVVIGAFATVPRFIDNSMNRVEPLNPVTVTPAARALHATLLIADMHADQPLWSRDLLRRSARGHTDLPRLQDGNVALQVFSAVTKTPKRQNYDANTGETDNITLLAILQRWPVAAWRSLRARAEFQAAKIHDAARRSDGALTVLTDRASLSAFLERRKSSPRATAALLAIEGLHALDGKIESVDTLAAHGYRMMGLAHFFDNEVAASAHGVSHGGLTPLGRRVVQRMEAQRLLVDVAHSSPQVMREVLAMVTRPIVVSHTGVAATCPGPRNLTDDQLRALAQNGAVIGIGYWDAAVCTLGAASVARAIRHAVNIAGVTHVALGSDFDGATTTPFATDQLAQLTQALLDQQFTHDEIALIMGGNVFRLLAETLP
jgi:membrane dipeptidase